MPVPRPVTSAAGTPEGGRDQRRRRGGVADAHVTDDQQVGAGGDLLGGDGRAGGQGPYGLGAGSARPRGRSAPDERRTLWAVTSAGSPVRSASTPRSSTRTETPCCRASTLTPATPATKAPTIAAVTSRG